MSDEEKDAVIDRAARAYREIHGGTSADAARTRARIFATRERDRRRAVLAMAAAVVLAIGLGVPTAWAWSTGRLARWLGAEAPADEAPAEVGESDASDRARAGERSDEGADVEVVPPAPETEIAPPEEIVAEPEPAIAPAAPVEPTTTPAPRAAEEDPPVDPAERRAYREAHSLHFDARDPAGALAAWDRYLRDYPSGRFAIEARYNRALCLVRLDRRDEARIALAPFAAGRYGEYRQREATSLIEALAP